MKMHQRRAHLANVAKVDLSSGLASFGRDGDSNSIAIAMPSAPDLRPRMVTLTVATKLYGLSRSEWYRRHDRGDITLRKNGSRTMVLTEEVEALINRLPRLPRRAPALKGASDV